MKRFDFYKDEKVIYWERTSFSVKSKTYEDAINVVEQLLKTNLNESDTVSIDGCYFIENIGIPMTLEQNEGVTTVKIFNSNDQLVVSNGTKDR